MAIFKSYHYSGPIYYNGMRIAQYSNIHTRARSISEARKNLLYKISDGDVVSIPRYDIADNFISVVDDQKEFEQTKKIQKCPTCGYQLNEIGDCPVCDYNEYDLLDTI